MKLLLCVIMTLSCANSAHAWWYPGKGIVEAKRMSKQVRRSFKRGQMGYHTQLALNNMLERSFKLLEERGLERAARIYRRSYNDSFSTFLTNHRVKALYDHEPLAEWIDEYYGYLEAAVGKGTLESLHLDDIKVLNYSLPITFQPAEAFHREDYKEHCVPTMYIVSYWAALGACLAATEGAGAAACLPAAEAIRYGVRIYIAPPTCSYIYEQAVE